MGVCSFFKKKIQKKFKETFHLLVENKIRKKSATIPPFIYIPPLIIIIDLSPKTTAIKITHHTSKIEIFLHKNRFIKVRSY